MFIRVWKPLPSRRVLKLRLTMIYNKPKQTISANGGIEPLQMVSEPVTRRCANEDAVSNKGSRL